MTSSWADGSAGPLGICYPQGAFKQSEVSRFNSKHKGVALLFCSEKRTHFMCAETFVVLPQDLYTHAYAAQREKYGISISTPGMLLADAWSGYGAKGTGQDAPRAAWSSLCNVLMPDPQPGGWSACNQPVDQLHHILRGRLDLVDCGEAGFCADIRSRKRYQDMPIKPTGQPGHPAVNTASLAERTLLAWKSV